MVGYTGYIEDSDLFKTEKPYRYHGPHMGLPEKNFVRKELEMPLTDIRTVPDFKPTIDSHGFCFIENKSKELPTTTDETNSQPYADEMADLLKDMTKADTVFAVNTRVRFRPYIFQPRIPFWDSVQRPRSILLTNNGFHS